MSRSSQRGFTLIELVVVIVILGILAAFAVPRFARLDQQARIAAVRSLEGALRSSATLARSLQMTAGTPTVNMEGQVIGFTNGYPNLATIDNTLAPGTIQAGVPGRWTYTQATGLFSLNGATNPAQCSVTYTPPAAVNQPPLIVVPNQATLNAAC